MKTKDSGKPCRSKADCESECITESKAPPGTEVTGICYGWLITIGTCLTHVEDGKVGGTLCVD